MPGFLRDTLRIRRQLRSTHGIVGYALLAELSHKRFFTFSAWETREDLDTFARTNPHARIIRRLAPKMQKTIFEFTTIPGSRLPLAWVGVKSLLGVNRA
jgi:heme-degrading monooxygenase HmoA